MLQISLTAVKQRIDPYYNPKENWHELLVCLNKRRATKAMFPLETVLDKAGINNALWALEAVEGYRNAMRLYDCYCARKALLLFEKRYPDDVRLRNAVDAAELYARGEARQEDLTQAGASVKDVHKELRKDNSVTLGILEELYESLNAVAYCVGVQTFTFTESVNFEPGATYGVFWTALKAAGYFITNIICNENQSKNAKLNVENPIKTVLKKYYTFPVLDAVDETLMNALCKVDAIEVIADEALRALSENKVSAPDLETIKDIALYAIHQIIFRSVSDSIKNSVRDAVQEDLTDEFRRLCRLEGPYGEVD
jgi:hypothetical protein